MTPGYKTTEFWLSLLVVLLGAVAASGVLPQGGMAAQVVGGIMAILASMGYTASRTQVKKADIVTPADGPELPK